MDNWTIQENFVLPSHAKIYEGDVKETFTLRSMTTSEEMLRLAPSDHEYDVLCNIIDKCMVDSPGISTYDMCLGDYQYCLYMLRVVTYGPDYKIAPKCPYCGNISKESFSLHDLKILEYNEDLAKYIEFELPACKQTIVLQPQTPRLLDNILDRVKRYKKKIDTSLDSTILCELMSTIRLVDGVDLNELQLENWVRNLNMQDVNTILNYSKKLNDSIGVDPSFALTCNFCGLTYKSKLAMTQEFFRPTLDI